MKIVGFEWKLRLKMTWNFSARREIRTMALRSRLLTELNRLFSIMNDMNSDDNLSKEDDNHEISPMGHGPCDTVRQ